MIPSPPQDERAGMASVALIGNDAMLAAAPATPVQLAHACLRRGFTVAIPTSWGDELIATETLRQLATRPKGPAVMCVCPYVRARLLAPGPDLAPFLVSLVAPPVAVARYLRALYGERGVNITFIGGCPSGDDPSIDVHLTPDAFLADLAEQGIALGEQPLVFDSIVPPDRRRWHSLPGGVPSPEVLWGEHGGRALVELGPEDISTGLAQHIIAHEHALIDLAPGLGCACSGAIASIPARGARVAVAALEPPRALGPVTDPAVPVSIEAPLGVPRTPARQAAAVRPPAVTGAPARPAPADEVTASVRHSPQRYNGLDATAERLRSSDRGAARRIERGGIDHAADVGATSSASSEVTERPVEIEAMAEPAAKLDDESDAATLVDMGIPRVSMQDSPIERVPSVEPEREQSVGVAPRESSRGIQTAPARPSARAFSVRRRTPTSGVRQPSLTVPTATHAGRPLPRAYVARRRTPPAANSNIRLDRTTPHGSPVSAAAESSAAEPSARGIGKPTAERPRQAGDGPAVAQVLEPGQSGLISSATERAMRPSSPPPRAASTLRTAEPVAPPAAAPTAASGSPTADARGFQFLLVVATLVALGVLVVTTLR